MSKIKLGEKVKDTITGFKGVVIARTESLHDLPSCRVAPTALDNRGKPVDPCWFPESRLELDAPATSTAAATAS